MSKTYNFQKLLTRYKETTLISILLIIYAVGVIGLTSEYRPDFLPLSFVNLIISFLIIIISRYHHNKNWYYFILFSFSIGMIVEWVGVHTGFLFGNYSYGENLGVKLFEVPVIIGVNWVTLTIITAAVADFISVKWFLKAMIAALLMLLLDILIEPVAIVSDYWHWKEDIPLSNFITWFLVALFLQILYFKFNLAEKNKVAVVLYIIQIVFFLILNIA